MDIDIELVRRVVAFLLAHPDARVMDVMAEFDVSDTEALALIRAARTELVGGVRENG